MRLLLIRHAIAVAGGTPGCEDEDRPLTPKGARRFHRAARGLWKVAPRPDLLMTSPLRRARETAEILVAESGNAESGNEMQPHIEDSLASGDLKALARALEGQGKWETAALIGHEPHMSALLARLLGTREGGRMAFRKGGAALVETSDFPNEGRLLWFLPPRILRRLGRD